jgi:isoamylase
MKTHASIFHYYKTVIKLRKDNPVFKRSEFFTGMDNDGDGIKDIQWHGAAYKDEKTVFDNRLNRVIAWRLDGSRSETKAATDGNDFYIAANHGFEDMDFQLPPNTPGKKWYRVADTAAWAQTSKDITNNIETAGQEDGITDGTWTDTKANTFAGNASYKYKVGKRSMIILMEK